MTRRSHLCESYRRGFSLTELAIVLAVIGIVIAGVWTYAGSARQTTRVEQSVEAVALTADAVRAAYGGQASISGGVSTVVPLLAGSGALPSSLLRNTSSTCSGISSNYADTPWGGSLTTYACGTLLVCAWNYGTSIVCGTPVTMQYFAIEFQGLDYGSCIAVAERVVPTAPRGLVDVYINATAATGAAASGGLPVTPSFATTNCKTTVPPVNKVDFIYSLRAPLT